VLVLAAAYGVDLERSFVTTMDGLERTLPVGPAPRP
jgi:hypothetical protein